MKLIIAGGRDYKFKPEDFNRLSKIHWHDTYVTEVVSGGALGADRGGEMWAAAERIPIKFFRPDWEEYGKAAGPIRNRQMAEYADAVALFPGGRGTESMRIEAKVKGLRIFDFTSEQSPQTAPPPRDQNLQP
jgi:hypothetical protein